MAESISEGTLKTWLKQVGDSVAADEEVATIETDKVCVPTLLPRKLSCICMVACAPAPTPKHIYPTLTLPCCMRAHLPDELASMIVGLRGNIFMPPVRSTHIGIAVRHGDGETRPSQCVVLWAPSYSLSRPPWA